MSEEPIHSPESKIEEPSATPFAPPVEPELEAEPRRKAEAESEPRDESEPKAESEPEDMSDSTPTGGPQLPQCAILSSFSWNNGGSQGWAMGLQRSVSVYGSLPAWVLLGGLVAVSVGSFMVGSTLGVSAVAIDLGGAVLEGQ